MVIGEKATRVAQVFLQKGAEALETLVREAGGPERDFMSDPRTCQFTGVSKMLDLSEA